MFKLRNQWNSGPVGCRQDARVFGFLSEGCYTLRQMIRSFEVQSHVCLRCLGRAQGKYPVNYFEGKAITKIDMCR